MNSRSLVPSGTRRKAALGFKALVACLPLLAVGCGYNDGRRYGGYYNGNGSGTAYTQCGTVVHSTIDTDASIEADPGVGAGLLVQYAAGGHWNVRATCDTTTTAATCGWDLIVTPASGVEIVSVQREGLEASDFIGFDSTGLQFTATTGADTDGFSFDSEPGAEMEFDTLLDNACATRYFFWFGDGAQHNGSPSNPIWLTPSTP